MALMAKMDSTDAAVNVGSGLQATSPVCSMSEIDLYFSMFFFFFFSIDLLWEAV